MACFSFLLSFWTLPSSKPTVCFNAPGPLLSEAWNPASCQSTSRRPRSPSLLSSAPARPVCSSIQEAMGSSRASGGLHAWQFRIAVAPKSESAGGGAKVLLKAGDILNLSLCKSLKILKLLVINMDLILLMLKLFYILLLLNNSLFLRLEFPSSCFSYPFSIPTI